MAYTTIMIEENIKELLQKLKTHPRQSYNEVLKKIIMEYIEEHKLRHLALLAQQEKMREVWLNEGDEVWEKA